jgi:hypothetical protein
MTSTKPLSFVWQQPALRSTFITEAIFVLTINNSFVVFPAIARQMHMGASAFGLLELSFATGCTIGAMLGLSKPVAKMAEPDRVVIGSLLLSGAMVALAHSNTELSAYIAAFAFGLGMLAVTTGSNSAVQRHTPATMMGRVAGLHGVCTNGLVPVGLIVLNLALAVLGVATGLTLGAVIAAVVALVVWKGVK